MCSCLSELLSSCSVFESNITQAQFVLMLTDGSIQDADGGLGSLVSFDLDSNLRYRLDVSMHKLHIGGSPQVKAWVKEHMQRTKVSSIARVSGGVFRAPAAAAAAARSGAASASDGFWSEDVAALVAARPDSRWAIVDWRHLLSPANILEVPRGELHFSRAITGEPIIVPSSPAAPPHVDVDSTLRNKHGRQPGHGPYGAAAEASAFDAAQAEWLEEDMASQGGRQHLHISGRVDTVPAAPLQKADRSLAVQELQFALIQSGFMRPSAIRFHAGIYGRHTMSAVGALQAVYGISPTGVYDEATEEALRALMARDALTEVAGGGMYPLDTFTYPLPADLAAEDEGAVLASVNGLAGLRGSEELGQFADSLDTGPALFPSEVYARMQDANKSELQLEATNGTVMAIAGTEEERFRVWNEEKDGANHGTGNSGDTDDSAAAGGGGTLDVSVYDVSVRGPNKQTKAAKAAKKDSEDARRIEEHHAKQVQLRVSQAAQNKNEPAASRKLPRALRQAGGSVSREAARTARSKTAAALLHSPTGGGVGASAWEQRALLRDVPSSDYGPVPSGADSSQGAGEELRSAAETSGQLLRKGHGWDTDRPSDYGPLPPREQEQEQQDLASAHERLAFQDRFVHRDSGETRPSTKGQKPQLDGSVLREAAELHLDRHLQGRDRQLREAAELVKVHGEAGVEGTPEEGWRPARGIKVQMGYGYRWSEAESEGGNGSAHSPRICGGWREQSASNRHGRAGRRTLSVVEGSLPMLIPHEPVISGTELVARVNAMQGAVAAGESAQLQAARAAMLSFARKRTRPPHLQAYALEPSAPPELDVSHSSRAWSLMISACHVSRPQCALRTY